MLSDTYIIWEKSRKKTVRKERIDDLFRKKSLIARYKTFESCPRLG